MVNFKPFLNQVKPNWCPGCGDYAVLNAIQNALANAGLSPHEVSVVSGIGCSGRFSGYLYAYGFHATHGRALPVAQGIKLANRDLTVLATGGDGDGFAIGAAHTVHAFRRNVDITYVVMDNHIYGLTKGQASPRSDIGLKTKTTPLGAVETPLAIMELALSAGATFIAQSFSLRMKELISLIEQGIQHKGFSFINVFSPCVSFNSLNTYDWYKEHLIPLESLPEYNPHDRMQAMKTLMEHHGLVTGLIYQDTEKKSYQELLPGYNEKPLAQGVGKISQEDFDALSAEFL